MYILTYKSVQIKYNIYGIKFTGNISMKFRDNTKRNILKASFTDYNRGGFTLAEVLITLGIIGVVAAITLPAVINKIQHKQLETAFKKSYSGISQVVQRITNEEGVIPDVTNFSGGKGTELVEKYFSVAKPCLH